jgi:hypothetical protein
LGLTRPLSLAEKLVVAVIGLGLVHHADHVLRADHYGFPFKPQVTLFTFTLGFYVIFATVLWARSHPWSRVWAMAFVVVATLLRTMIEPPQQIWGTWADNVSRPAPLFTPDGSKNQLNVESPLLAVLAIVDVLLLQAAMIGALVLFIGEARRGRPRADRSATRAPGSL